MSQLVDKERLARLAKALDSRAKAAVAAEKERAMGVEAQLRTDVNAKVATEAYNAKVAALEAEDERIAGLVATEIQDRKDAIADESALRVTAEQAIEAKADANATAIATLKGDANTAGSVAKAVADAVKVEKERAEGVENGLAARIAANEAFVAAQPAIDAEQDRRIKALEDANKEGGAVAEAVQAAQDAADAAQDAADAAQDAAEAADAKAVAAQSDVDAVEQRLDAEGGLVDRIEANETNIARLDGADTVEGSVKKQIKDAIDEVKGLVTGGMEDRVSALETFKDVTYPAAEAKVREDFVTADTTLETKLNKKIADDIAAESALRVAEEADIRADFAAADTTNLQAAKDYADQQITALVNSAPEAMNTLKELADAIEAHGTEYEAYVATVTADIKKAKEEAIAQAKTDAATADATLKADLQKEIDDDVKVEKERAVAEEAKIRGEFAAADTALSNRIKVFEAGGTQDVAAKEARLAAAETFIQEHSHEELQGEIDAVEGRVGALETFKNGHSHSTMEQGIADNKAAIEKEVKDRDAAIAEELKAYSDTAAVKAMLSNVINSLGLAIEGNKLQLTLGTSDYVIKEVELDLATDADIDAIINGLDAE